MEYLGRDYPYEIDDVADHEYEIYDIYERRCELDDWVHPELGSADYGSLELQPGELMPPERITDWEPDQSRLTEASGNAGAEVERQYRNAALVLWPTRRSFHVLAQAGVGALSVLLARADAGSATLESSDVPLDAVTLEVAEVWPEPNTWSYGSRREEWDRNTSTTLSRLCRVGNRDATELFLDRIVVPHYGPALDTALIEATSTLADEEMPNRLRCLVDTHFEDQSQAVVDLVASMNDAFGERQDVLAQGVLEDLVRHICSAVPKLADTRTSERQALYRPGLHERPIEALGERTLRQILHLAWCFELESSLTAVVDTLIDIPDFAPPDRTLPPVLSELGTSQRSLATASAAFARLWQHSADFLLGRSGIPPAEPADWVTSSNDLGCGCKYCTELVRFCADPVETTLRIPVRRDVREHLRSMVKSARADLSYETEAKGRPYTLICTKTRASYRRRCQQYSHDIVEIGRLLDAAHAVPNAADTAASLRTAITRSQEKAETTSALCP